MTRLRSQGFGGPSPRPPATTSVSRTFTRWDNFVDSVESLLGHPLSQAQLDDASYAFLEGESAVEFALTINGAIEDRGNA